MIFWLYLQTIWRRALNKVYFNELCYFHYHSYNNCNEEITFFYLSNTSVNTYSTLWSLRNFICSLQPFTPSASRCISSILFFVYFLWYWWGDCSNSELLQFGFISFLPHDFNVWFSGDTVWRNYMPVSLRGERVSNCPVSWNCMIICRLC